MDKICKWITRKIKERMPEMDEEKEVIISFGVFLLFRRVTENFSFIHIRIFVTNWLVFHFNLFFTSTISQLYRWIPLKDALGMYAK